MPYVIVYIQKYAELCDFEKRSVRLSKTTVKKITSTVKKNTPTFCGKLT